MDKEQTIKDVMLAVNNLSARFIRFEEDMKNIKDRIEKLPSLLDVILEAVLDGFWPWWRKKKRIK